MINMFFYVLMTMEMVFQKRINTEFCLTLLEIIRWGIFMSEMSPAKR